MKSNGIQVLSKALCKYLRGGKARRKNKEIVVFTLFEEFLLSFREK